MSKDDAISREWYETLAEKKGFLDRLFSAFLRNEPKRVEEIREAVAREDFEQLRFLTHSLKGSAATMGAERLRARCQLLEEAVKAEDRERIRTGFAEMEREVEDVFTYMREHMERPAP